MKKLISVFLAAIMTISSAITLCASGSVSAVAAENGEADDGSLSEFSDDSGEYADYIAKYADAKKPQLEIESNIATKISDYEGFSGAKITEGQKADFKAEVSADGLYAVKISYVACAGNNLSAEVSLSVDGLTPYGELMSLNLYKLFRDAGKPQIDEFGNEVRSEQEEVIREQTVFVTDSNGYNEGALYIYFKSGSHLISLKSVRGDILFTGLTLTQPKAVPETSDKSRTADASGEKIIIQAETPTVKSSSMLYASCDKTSYSVSPYGAGKEKINVLGGANFSETGQWVEYEFDIKNSGYYAISLKFKQNVSIGMTSYRNIYIDGSIPDKNFENTAFPYDTSWQSITVSDAKREPDLIFLESGRHTMRIEVTLGEYNAILSEIKESVKQLNSAYLESIMYLTTSPDVNRDYDVEHNLPEVIKAFSNQVQKLRKLSELIDGVVGGNNDSVTLIDRIVYQLDNIVKKPETYPKRLDALKSNITALAALITTLSSQPLMLDYITVYTSDITPDKAEAGFFKNVYNEILNFLVTFTGYYSMSGDESKDGITVWIPTGRDQYKVVKNLADNDFTPKTGIQTNPKLVTTAGLLPAVVAGKGPDVLLQILNSEPVNYAIRGAVYDLSKFSDCSEVLSRFSTASCDPLRLGKSVYALPETESFYMMFYRTDILEDLELSTPKTWDEFLVVTTEFQKNNLSVGLPNTLESFGMFLIQGGASFYCDDTYECNINTSAGLKAFTRYTDMFANYSLPLTYDALTRFRMGEMPIVIADYTFFNNLQVGAPEIANLWDFTIVPGTFKADGTLDHSVVMSGNACMMLASTENPQNSWEFMKWWTSADTQIAYGRNIEMILGTSGRVATANLEAAKALSWSKQNSDAIENGRKFVKGIENVPGSYFMSRHILNAFRSVALSGKDAKESLRYYSKIINSEIRNKCHELGISIEREKE